MKCFKPLKLVNPIYKKKYDLTDYWTRRQVEQDHDDFFVNIPCGHCESCIERKSNEWAVRIYYEWLSSDTAQFFTLTYADEYLTQNYVTFKYPTSEYEILTPVLCKRDAQLFMKRLRYYLGNGLRFFLGGEYGEQFSRPHYHFIIFNYPRKYTDDDLLEIVKQCWSYGNVQSGETNIRRVMYVAKYIYSDSMIDRRLVKGFVPPFILSSRMPGLGHQYIDECTKAYHNGSLETCVAIDDGRIMPMPRYYRGKLFSDESKEVLLSRFLEENGEMPTEDEKYVFLKRFYNKSKNKKI